MVVDVTDTVLDLSCGEPAATEEADLRQVTPDRGEASEKPVDNRPWLLFDLNGVLVEESKRPNRRKVERPQELLQQEHQQQPKQERPEADAEEPAAGGGYVDGWGGGGGGAGSLRRRNFRARPGIASLLRLRSKFRLGIYTSATAFTVSRALDSLSTGLFHEVRSHPEQLRSLREECAAHAAAEAARQKAEAEAELARQQAAEAEAELLRRQAAEAETETEALASGNGDAAVPDVEDSSGDVAAAAATGTLAAGEPVAIASRAAADTGSGMAPAEVEVGADAVGGGGGAAGATASGAEGPVRNLTGTDWDGSGSRSGSRGGRGRRGGGGRGGDGGFGGGFGGNRIDARVLFDRILHRDHCAPDPFWQQRPDGRSWDTMKPLAPHGLPLERCLLLDNESRKSAPGEERNLLELPTWEAAVDQGVGVWLTLVSELLALPEDPDLDVRQHVTVISGRIAALHVPKFSTAGGGAMGGGQHGEQPSATAGPGQEQPQPPPRQTLPALSKKQQRMAVKATLAAALAGSSAAAAVDDSGLAADMRRPLWVAAAEGAAAEAFVAESAAVAAASATVVAAAEATGWRAARRHCGDDGADGADGGSDGNGAHGGDPTAAAGAALPLPPDAARQVSVLRLLAQSISAAVAATDAAGAGVLEGGDEGEDEDRSPATKAQRDVGFVQCEQLKPELEEQQGPRQQRGLERQQARQEQDLPDLQKPQRLDPQQLRRDPRFYMLLASCTLAASFATRGSAGHQELVCLMGRYDKKTRGCDAAMCEALRRRLIRVTPRPSPKCGVRYVADPPPPPESSAAPAPEADKNLPAGGAADAVAAAVVLAERVREGVLEFQRVGGAHPEGIVAMLRDLEPVLPRAAEALVAGAMGPSCRALVSRGILGAWRWRGSARYYVRVLPDQDQLAEALRSLAAMEPSHDEGRLRTAGTVWAPHSSAAGSAGALAQRRKRKRVEGVEGRRDGEQRGDGEGGEGGDVDGGGGGGGEGGKERREEGWRQQAQQQQVRGWQQERPPPPPDRQQQQQQEGGEEERQRSGTAAEAERGSEWQRREAPSLEVQQREGALEVERQQRQREAERETERGVQGWDRAAAGATTAAAAAEEEEEERRRGEPRQREQEREGEGCRSVRPASEEEREEERRRQRRQQELDQEEWEREQRQREWEQEQEWEQWQRAAAAAMAAAGAKTPAGAIGGISHKRGRAGEGLTPAAPDPSLKGAVPLYGRPWTWPARATLTSTPVPSSTAKGRQQRGGVGGGGLISGRRPLSALHGEVAAFARESAPWENELTALTRSLAAVQRVASELWPTARVVLFGSQAAGLALPGSDLDLVVLGVTPNMARPAEGLSGAARADAARLLDRLARRLKGAGLIRSHSVIKAKVPIVKTALLPLDEHGRPAGRGGAAGRQLSTDISIGAANGAAAVALVQRAVAWLPPLRPLCLVVKALLKEAGLNEVFTGGVSSYSLINMVMAHLACEGYDVGPVVQTAKSATTAGGAAAGARRCVDPGPPAKRQRRRYSDSVARDNVYDDAEEYNVEEYDADARGGGKDDDVEDAEEDGGPMEEEQDDVDANDDDDGDGEEGEQWVGSDGDSSGGGSDTHSPDEDQDLELHFETDGDMPSSAGQAAAAAAGGGNGLRRSGSSPLDWPHAAPAATDAASCDRESFDHELAVMAEAAASTAEAAAVMCGGGGSRGAAAAAAAAAAQPVGLPEAQLSYLRALSRQSTSGADLGELLHGFFVRFGHLLDPSREAVSILRGGVTHKLPAWRKTPRGAGRGGGALLAVEDPQQRGKDICSGSYNIGGVLGRFARAARRLAAAAGQQQSGPQHRNTDAEGRIDEEGSERAQWAAVQADGSHRSLEAPATAAAGGRPGGGGSYRILRGILDPDLALCRSDAMASIRAKHTKQLSRVGRAARRAAETADGGDPAGSSGSAKKRTRRDRQPVRQREIAAAKARRRERALARQQQQQQQQQSQLGGAGPAAATGGQGAAAAGAPPPPPSSARKTGIAGKAQATPRTGKKKKKNKAVTAMKRRAVEGEDGSPRWRRQGQEAHGPGLGKANGSKQKLKQQQRTRRFRIVQQQGAAEDAGCAGGRKAHEVQRTSEHRAHSRRGGRRGRGGRGGGVGGDGQGTPGGGGGGGRGGWIMV